MGLGAILARASSVTDSMVEAASLALADSLTPEERAEDRVYPNLTRIRRISALIASRVIKAAQVEVRLLSWLLSFAWLITILIAC